MRITVSKDIGFCFGVRNTLVKARQCLSLAKDRGCSAYSIGNLIHNEYVVRQFTEQGLKVIIQPDGNESGIALVRAHGIESERRKDFENEGFTLIDSTCINIRKTLCGIQKAASEGCFIVVIGQKGHAETNTLLGNCDAKKALVCDVCDIEAIGKNQRIAVAVQTTFSEDLYERICDRLKKDFSDVVFLNGLCSVCVNRKREAWRLSEQCDALVVVGSSLSANTKELASYLEKSSKSIFMLGGRSDFTDEVSKKLLSFEHIGVVSGTSAPMEQIREVCDILEALT